MVERYKPPEIVGYMRPPQRTQFKKGKSGNPKGRPKKRDTVAEIIADELNMKVEITENGRSMKIEKSRVLIKKIINGAITNNMKDFVLMMKNIELFERFFSTGALEKLQRVDLSKLTLEEKMQKMKELMAATKPLKDY